MKVTLDEFIVFLLQVLDEPPLSGFTTDTLVTKNIGQDNTYLLALGGGY